MWLLNTIWKTILITDWAINDTPKTIETINTLRTDQKAEGKKEGYSYAKSKYESVYSDLEKKYEKIISDIQSKRTDLDLRSDEGLEELEQLEKERNRLVVEMYNKVNSNIESKQAYLDAHSNEGLEELVQLEKKWDRLRATLKNKVEDDGSEAFNDFTGYILAHPWFFYSPSIWRDGIRGSIILKKMNERMKARQEGYVEARALYIEKIQQLKDHFNEVKEKADAKFNDYANRVSALLDEIEKIKLQIAEIKIAMGD